MHVDNNVSFQREANRCPRKKKKKIKNDLSSALAAMGRGEAYIGKVLIQREVVRKCSHVLLQKLLL